MRPILKTASCLGLVLSFTACGEVAQSPDTVRMAVQSGGTAVTGTYRTESFSRAQVRQMVGRICTNAGFASFDETVSGNLIAFSATCAGSTRYTSGADAVFVQQDDGTVDYTITYSQNGRPLETGGNFRV
ncbi:hypothetical protein [uncultured Tateyamaria sp.]|uniref:hypothetical protein n=1 Tax=Tateyamaria sp. 1078 TaxID=3417464 RepID=UPI00262D10B0|nr:hypothetical protein [uncultured Tateyamaria sp.]